MRSSVAPVDGMTWMMPVSAVRFGVASPIAATPGMAPGFLDERAEAFDASIAAALAAGDAEALAVLDAELGAELWAAGVPALRTLGELAKGADIVANLRVDVAPFGVGYWVADWVLS